MVIQNTSMLWHTLDRSVAEVWRAYVSQWVSTKLQFTSSSLLLIELEDVVGFSIRQWCAENEVNFTSERTNLSLIADGGDGVFTCHEAR